jgi:hypothetical protein
MNKIARPIKANPAIIPGDKGRERVPSVNDVFTLRAPKAITKIIGRNMNGIRIQKRRDEFQRIIRGMSIEINRTMKNGTRSD